MSIYQSGETNINGGDLSQTEVHIYGSIRLGIYNLSTDVQCTSTIEEITTFIRGNKFLELSNHLGNVLVTVSDKKLQHTSNNSTIDYYTADVVTANDYYPGGMQMPGRKYLATSSSKYRYSINGQEKESELNENITTALYWEYDSRILRRWNIDPQAKIWQSPYSCFNNNSIEYADPLGLKGTDNIYKDNKTGKSIRVKTNEHGNRLFSGAIKPGADLNNLKVSDFDVYGGVDMVPDKGYKFDPETDKFVPGNPTTIKPKTAPTQVTLNTKQQPNSEPKSEDHKTKNTKTVLETTENAIVKTAEKAFEKANEIKAGKILERSSTALKVTSTVINSAVLTITLFEAGHDLKTTGTIEDRHIIDGVAAAMCFIPGAGQIWGSFWFVGNLISLGINGKTISENVQEATTGKRIR